MTPLQQTLDGVQPEIVVSVGTDLHLFNRLIDWVDDWLEIQEERPTCLVQHGASRAPKNALGISRMSRDELLDLYAGAKVVIVQGGPGSILDAREVGALPIAVPRWPEKHEVVDGHQIAFTQTMELHGEAVAVHSEDQLRTSLEAALQNPEQFQKCPRISDPENATQSLEAEIRKMMQEPRNPQLVKKAWRMLRARRAKPAGEHGSGARHGAKAKTRSFAAKFAGNARAIQNRLQP